MTTTTMTTTATADIDTSTDISQTTATTTATTTTTTTTSMTATTTTMTATTRASTFHLKVVAHLLTFLGNRNESTARFNCFPYKWAKLIYKLWYQINVLVKV